MKGGTIMRIIITFPGNSVDSRELYEDLKRYNVNVTDMSTCIYVYRDGITANEIAKVLSICDKYGTYDVSITALKK